MTDPAPPLPQGLSPFHKWAKWVTSMILRMRVMDRDGTQVHRTTRGVMVSGGGEAFASGGWIWASDKAYDMTKSYRTNTRGGEIVWMWNQNPAVTVGTIDPDTGEQAFSVPGLWICLKNVGPVVNPIGLPNATYYRIPQWPMPNPDDIKDPKNYWYLVSAYNVCV